MPTRQREAPDLGGGFWERPELLQAAQLGRLDLFLRAYRGTPWATQDDVARRTGYSQAFVSYLETRPTAPNPQRLHRIFEGLAVPVHVQRLWGE